MPLLRGVPGGCGRPSDETLLLAVADRDLGAFRTLYERHAGWLAAATVLLPICFALPAAAAAFTSTSRPAWSST